MELQQGIVLRSTGGQNNVKIVATGEVIECTVRGKIRLKGIRSTNPIVVGDFVKVQIDKSTNTGTIMEIDDRRNYIIRRSTNLSKESHILASNIDQILIIATIREPVTSLMFIDRLLITSEAYNIPAKIVFNKIDLCQQEEHIEQVAEYMSIYELAGYECFVTSVKQKIGLDKFAETINNKITLLSGNSGVGKSSLVNQIDPSLNLKIGNISSAHRKGKHTTTFASMYEIAGNGYIVDTPGIRAFGLLSIDKQELSHYFPEIFKKSEQCKFYNCTHIHEPGCNVIAAVENGDIPFSRYQNYVNIFLDKEEEKYRTDDYS